MTELEDKLATLVEYVDHTINEFQNLINMKHQEALSSTTNVNSVKILRELVQVDELFKNNISRLKRITKNIHERGELLIYNDKYRNELKELLVRTSTSFKLVNKILGKQDPKVRNIVNDTVHLLDNKMISGS